MFRIPQNTPIEQLNMTVKQTAESIGQFVKHSGDFTRKRKLDAETTMRVILDMQGNSINAELLAAFPNLSDRMTASAFEQAKDKLTPQVFDYLLAQYNATNTCNKLLDGKYSLYAIDGSDFSVPFNNGSEFVVTSSLGRPKKNGEDAKPFSMLHANILFNLLDRTYEGCIIQSKMQSQERVAAIEMLKRLRDKQYIVIMDRGYDGFNMIEHCNKLPGCHYIIRTKTGNGGIREIAALPDKECDRDMVFEVTTSGHYYQSNKDKKSIHLVRHVSKHYKERLSENTKDGQWDHPWLVNIKCRVVKFKINDPGTGRETWEVLLTNLDRSHFPVNRLKNLYHKRWDIETSFRELKYALGGISFHSKKDDFIKMELLAHLIMFNAVSRSIALVVVPQAGHKHPYTIDFKMACLVVRKYYRIHCNDPPNSVFSEIGSYINPVREGRSDKRNIKPKPAIWFIYRVA